MEAEEATGESGLGDWATGKLLSPDCGFMLSLLFRTFRQLRNKWFEHINKLDSMLGSYSPQ